MTDLETRLGDALREAAGRAPEAVGLAGAARTRARRRRRTGLVLVATVTAVMVGLPTAVVVTRDGSGKRSDGHVAQDPDSGDAGITDMFHSESWHDVVVRVPDSWGYGSPASWCADGGTAEQGRIGRPGIAESIACTPTSSYGVTFAPANGVEVQWPVAAQHSEAWPDGAWVAATTVGDVVITVATDDFSLTGLILSTAERIDTVDDNGCAPELAAESLTPADGWVNVCRYDAGGGLEEGELLAADDAAAAVAALEAAPVANQACSSSSDKRFSLVRMRSEQLDVTVNLAGGCPRLLGLGEARELTSDVLYWALSPGWTGALDGDIPLPKELRQR